MSVWNLLRRSKVLERSGGRLLNSACRYATSRRLKNTVDSGELQPLSQDELARLAGDLKQKARDLGLGPTYVTTAQPSSRMKHYENWLARGFHGLMSYLSRSDRLARRRDPSIILPGVKTIIVTSLFYWPGQAGFPATHQLGNHSAEASEGAVSCYAWGRDYHDVLGGKVKALADWMGKRAGGRGRFYVDTGAVMERDLGERAGLGFIGKNTLLIHPKLGSGFFIGEIFSTVDLPVDEPIGGRIGCGKCKKCIVACPTGAFVENYVMDARKCISYLTIELKGTIPLELREGMGNKVYGCDICQQVCPWNRFDWEGDQKGKSPLFGSPPREVTSPKLVELLKMSEEDFRKRFEGTAVKRIGRDRLVRNAAVALGNVGGKQHLADLQMSADRDKSELVREHARWAIERIKVRLETLEKRRAQNTG